MTKMGDIALTLARWALGLRVLHLVALRSMITTGSQLPRSLFAVLPKQVLLLR